MNRHDPHRHLARAEDATPPEPFETARRDVLGVTIFLSLAIARLRLAGVTQRAASNEPHTGWVYPGE